MGETRYVVFTGPAGKQHRRARRRDLADPRFAIMTNGDGHRWDVYRVTQSSDELVSCIKGLLGRGVGAYVTVPAVEH